MSDDHTQQDDVSNPRLNAIEARVIGCLIEKQATTPENYPLTLNALVTACNQKTSRNPVLQLESGKVGQALRQLEQRRWVERQHGARAERWGHRMDQTLRLTAAQRVLMGLLLLRGPQTLNELLVRTERMHSFDDVDDLRFQLERLAQHSLTEELSRLPGQREARFAQRLAETGAETNQAPDPKPGSSDSPAAPAMDDLIQRLEAVEQRLAELENRLKQ